MQQVAWWEHSSHGLTIAGMQARTISQQCYAREFLLVFGSEQAA
jgi:hypothetical protein